MSVSPPQGKGAFDNKTPAGMVSGLAQKIIASSIAPQTAGGALNLNGIFYSDEGSYALVNNKIVKEGDVIEGWLVTRIGIGEVELKSNDLTIKLNKIK
jgi:hypothetical protein